MASSIEAAASDETEEDEPKGNAWSRQMLRKGSSFNGLQRDRLFFGHGDGTFEDLSDVSGADSPLDGRALLLADFDHDGDSDIFVHNIHRGRHGLYRNEQAGSGHFLKVRLQATESQYEAIGATVVVDGPRGPVAQVLARGSGFESCQPPELLFGLGESPSARVSVCWPGQRTAESFGEVEGDSTVLLVQGAGAPRRLDVPRSRLRDPLPAGLKLGVGALVPDLTVVSQEMAGDGEPISKKVVLDLAKLAGTGSVYLTFWASYCEPCLREIPDLQKAHASEERSVIAVSIDSPEDRFRASKLLEQHGSTYPSYFVSLANEDNQGGLDEIVDLLNLAIPTTLVVDGQGRIQAILEGPVVGD